MSNDDPKTWFVIRNGDDVAVDVTDTRTKHYVFFKGSWRRVPRRVQRLCDRYGARIFGTMATSTVYGDGYWTGSIR